MSWNFVRIVTPNDDKIAVWITAGLMAAGLALPSVNDTPPPPPEPKTILDRLRASGFPCKPLADSVCRHGTQTLFVRTGDIDWETPNSYLNGTYVVGEDWYLKARTKDTARRAQAAIGGEIR